MPEEEPLVSSTAQMSGNGLILGDLLQTSAEILLAAALKEPVHTYRYR